MIVKGADRVGEEAEVVLRGTLPEAREAGGMLGQNVWLVREPTAKPQSNVDRLALLHWVAHVFNLEVREAALGKLRVSPDTFAGLLEEDARPTVGPELHGSVTCTVEVMGVEVSTLVSTAQAARWTATVSEDIGDAPTFTR